MRATMPKSTEFEISRAKYSLWSFLAASFMLYSDIRLGLLILKTVSMLASEIHWVREELESESRGY